MLKNQPMFPDYQSLVMQHYEKKRSENNLPLRLSQPTTAKLKAECLNKFAKGISQKDKKILVDFFGGKEDDGIILKRIGDCEPDFFKPLWNYLNKKTSKTDPKNIELLAWLTDFEERPYDYSKNYTLNELQRKVDTPEINLNVAQNEAEKEEQAKPVEEIKIPEGEIIEEPPEILNPIVSAKPTTPNNKVEKKEPFLTSSKNDVKQRINPKIIIASLAVAMSVVIGILMYKKNGEEGCMYWAGDTYKQVPCSQKMGDTMVIALDMERLNSLKRITREDTITRSSKGWVWYIKLNNKVEFYTSGGNYPLDPTLRLKPITDYIIDKYIDTAQ